MNGKNSVVYDAGRFTLQRQSSSFDYQRQSFDVHSEYINDIHFSPELISDEYKHNDNSRGVVHIFRVAKQKDNCKLIQKTFNKCGYNVPDDNIHSFKDVDKINEKMRIIGESIKPEDTNLIIFFLGYKSPEDGQLGCERYNVNLDIKNVWSTYLLVENLRYKPKIFVFHATQICTDNDSIRKNDSKYDAPVEADLFIVKKTSFNKYDTFIQTLCRDIVERGEHTDIWDLVTQIPTDPHDPRGLRHLIISTLTRKFYLMPSGKYRGHYLKIHQNYKEIKELMNEISTSMEDYRKEQLKNGKEKKGKLVRIDSKCIKSELRPSTSSTGSQTSLTRPRSNSANTKPPWK